MSKTKAQSLSRAKLRDRFYNLLFKGNALLSALIIFVIVFFVGKRGIAPFINGQVNPLSFISGNLYRSDRGIYGVGFIIVNTILTSFAALLLATPLAVMTALFIEKIAPKSLSVIFKNIIELLAGVPSIVYGVFGAGVITQLIKNIAASLGIATYGGSSQLAVIMMLAIIIFPTLASLSMTAIHAVSHDLEMGSLALGATPMQTNFKVVLRDAKSGIFAGAILALGRAFGEATAVSMVAGNKFFGPTWSLFDITRTLTSTMLSGLKETSGLDYDIRFSIGLVLIVLIFFSNVFLNYIKKRIEKRYA